MTFVWSEFEGAAQLLEEQATKGACPDACLRSAVSRYYYAAFCHARNYLRDKSGYIPKFNPTYDYQDHSQVRKHLEKYAKHYPAYKQLAKKLQELHEWRKQSDYQDELQNLQLIVTSARKNSQHIISTLS